jgi:hypothetical protein
MPHHTDEHIRTLIHDETEQLADLERKISMLLRLLNHKGILKEADIIEVEA